MVGAQVVHLGDLTAEARAGAARKVMRVSRLLRLSAEDFLAKLQKCKLVTALYKVFSLFVTLNYNIRQ